MLHLPVALNPKVLVGNMSLAVLMATFPHTPSFSYLGHPNVPAQAAVALASGPEPKGVGGGLVRSGPDGQLSLHTKFELSRTILAIPTYLQRQMLHLPVALSPKELV